MLSADERRPLLNKTLNSLYPPGIDAEADGGDGAARGRHRPRGAASIARGGYQLGNRFFRCLGRHGSMNMHRAIARSCNTYFYAMGRRIGYDAIAVMARKLGLGAKYDLPVVSQSYGTIPDSEWKMRRYKQNGAWWSGPTGPSRIR